MKVECKIHANCSELEVHLGVTSSSDRRVIIEILKEVMHATGWRLATKDSLSILPDYLGYEDLDNHLAIVKSKEGFMDFKTIYWVNRDTEQTRRLKEKVYEWDTVGLYLISPEADDYLNLPFSNGYDREDELALQAQQHCSIGEYEPLAKLVRAKNLSWHTHDGGDAWPFGHWCMTHGYIDVAREWNREGEGGYRNTILKTFKQCDDTEGYSSRDGRRVTKECWICGKDVTGDQGKNPRRETYWSRTGWGNKITVVHKE